MKKYIPSMILIIVLLLIWQGVSRAEIISKSFLPAPSAIFTALVDHYAIISEHTIQTSLEALIGLGLSIVLGIAMGITIFSSDSIRKSVYPLLVLSQTIPIIALAPLLLLWFGFGLLPKVIVVVLYSFFPIAVAFSDALLQTEKHYVDLLNSMQATRWQILRMVRIPASLPALFSGIRIGTTYAMTGAVVGEYVGAYKGLGIFMQTSANAHATSLVFAALFVVIAITLILLTAVSIAEKLVIPWKNKS